MTIQNLYWNRSAILRIEGENTDNVKIMRRVRQGCVLSPLIFNLYSERISMVKGILIKVRKLQYFGHDANCYNSSCKEKYLEKEDLEGGELRG